MAFKKLVMLVFVAVLLLTGCTGGKPAAPEAQAPAAPTDTSAPTNTATATVDTVATQSAQQTLDAQATTDAKATAEAAEATRAELDKQATETQKVALEETEKAAVQATSTAYASAFMDVINKLKDDGVIGSTEGDFYHINDFQEEMAMLNYFRPYETGYAGENFVFQADIAWSVASMGADWSISGCGLMFGQEDGDNYDFTFLGLDGFVKSWRWTNGSGQGLAMKHWGKPELPEGNARFLISAWDKRFNVYVNDEPVSSFLDSRYRPGDISLTMISGSNKDYGIRCTMTDVNLFIFK